jgi:hemoglobin-like flavoprotein
MNDHTIQIVKESYDLVEPIAPQAAAMFYEHLLAIDPSVRTLVGSDMDAQGRQLMQMFSDVVGRLGEPEALMPRLQDLASRPAVYGLSESNYDSARLALLATLKNGLGVAYNEEVEEAWDAVYGAVTQAMKRQASSRVAA